MQGVTGKVEELLQTTAPASLDKLEIAIFRWTIDLVSHDRMPKAAEMNSYLVRSSRLGHGAHNSKRTLCVFEPAEHLKVCCRVFAIGMSNLLNPDSGFPHFALPEYRLGHPLAIPLRPPGHYRKVFLLDLSALHRSPKTPRSLPRPRHQNQPTRLPIKTIKNTKSRIILASAGEPGLHLSE